MKFFLQSFLPLTLIFASLPILAQSPDTDIINGNEVKASQAILKLAGPAGETVLKQLKLLGDADDLRLLSSPLSLYVLHSKSASVAVLLKTLKSLSAVQYVEPDYIVKAVVIPNDPNFTQQWSFLNTSTPGADIGATNAWAVSTGSTANVVGVVDTGIDYNHPDLAANIWSAPTSFTVNLSWGSLTCPAGSHGYNSIQRSCDPMDDHGHGTHVSGTIGAIGNNGAGVAGINWTTRIMGLKFLDSAGSGTLSDAIDAIEFALQTETTFGGRANIRVFSNSWGGSGYSQGLLDEINKANTANALFVVAAGNSNQNNDIFPSYPAAYHSPNIITVAATTSTDTLASFSSYGPTTVHIGAPGVSILSTWPNAQYATASGTSMATPHVSGAAMLVLSVCNLNTAALKNALLASVDPLPGLSGITITGGRLNVYKAILSCSTNQPQLPSITTAFGQPRTVVDGTTSLNYTITNPNVAVVLSGIGFTDHLPAGLVVATPNGLNGSCSGGSITATAGSGTLGLAGATLAPGASCTFGVNVTAVTDGLKNNTTGAVTSSVGENSLGAAATLLVASPPTLTKAFAYSQIQVSGPSNSTPMSFTVANPNTVTTLTGLAFIDTLPSGLVVSTPNGLYGSCGGGVITAAAGSNSISLSGTTLPPGVSCSFSVSVTGIAVGVQTNTTSAVSSNESVPGDPAKASTSVVNLFFTWFLSEGGK